VDFTIPHRKHDIELLKENGVIVVLNECVKSKELLKELLTLSVFLPNYKLVLHEFGYNLRLS
jgi:hypothetical protein